MRELFAAINLLCGAGVFVFLLAYLLLAQPRRTSVAVALLLVSFLCALNALTVYFLI